MFMIAFSALFLAIVIKVAVKLYRTRDIDIFSYVATKIVVNLKLIHLLSKLHLTDLLRPKTVIKVDATSEFTFTTVPYFNKLTQYVRKFELRDSDVVVASYPKAGTTWVQEIVWLICHNADINTAMSVDLTRRTPFLETADVGKSLGFQALENWPIDSIRIIKTHTPYEILPTDACVRKKGKIIYVCRNPKDVCVSYYHFHDITFSLPRARTWEEFLQKFCQGNVPWGSWFAHTQKYWGEFKKNSGHVHFVTYESLKMDLRKEVQSLARFLGKHLSDEQIDMIASHCTFDNMKNNSRVNFDNMEKMATFDFSKTKFMRKGEVGDWKNYFTINQSAAFDEMFDKKMEGTGLNVRFEI